MDLKQVVSDQYNEIDQLRAEVERLTAVIDDVAQVLDGTRELNMSNFDIDDVAQLNSSHCEIYQIIHKAAEAVRPLHEEKWVLHLIGPDDVIDQPDEMTALREANKLNIGLARRRAEDPSDHDPYCWAVVKDAATEPV